MRYGVISDIHSNLEALESVIDALADEGIDCLLCVGDIVGYGANPAQCLKRIKDLEAVTVCGNHDAASASIIDTGNFNELALQAIEWTKRRLRKEDMDFIKNLELVYKDEEITAVHGTLDEPAEFNYMANERRAALTFDRMDTKICFVGHSHICGMYLETRKGIAYNREIKLRLRRNDRAIINVGSIGQPRDDDPRAGYCVYDTKKKTVFFSRISYDVKKTQRKILNAGLPDFFAYRLGSGI